MTTLLRLLTNPKTRTYLYGIGLAVLPLLVVAGIVTKDDAPLWVVLVGAILVPGTAYANRPTKGGRQ